MSSKLPSINKSFHKFLRGLRPALISALVSTIWTPVASGNVVGSSFQNFNPTHSGRDFVTVYSSSTIGKGNFSLGLFLNRATNTLPYVDGTAKEVDQSRGNTNDALLGADLTAGFGILDNLDIGIAVPQVLSQSVDSDRGTHGQFEEKGLTDFRVSSKWALLNTRAYGFAVVGSANINQTQNNPFKGAERSPSYTLEFAGDLNLSRISLAANLGYRLLNSSANENDVPINPTGNQIVASAAVSYAMPSIDSKLIAEYFSSTPVKAQDDVPSRDDSSSELIAGIKHNYNNNLILHAGGGTELHHGLSTPDWRVYAGMNYMTDGKTRTSPAPQIASSKQQPDQVLVIDEILFRFDSANMASGNKKTMDNIAKLLNTGAAIQRVVIEGHTCNMGDSAYNQKLSYKRAQTIKDALVRDYGFKSQMIKAVGFGESVPVASNSTADGRKKNRRVEFKIFRNEAVASK